MKNGCLVFLISLFFISCSSVPKLVKVWEVSNIPVPESVLPVPEKNILYVSLIDGKGWEADGKGGIGILSPNGKNFNANWITGLSAPKGMGILNGKLYVTDITDVVIINIEKGIVEKKIRLTDAENLNDITIGNGKVYVSDSKAAAIWELSNDIPSLYLTNVPATNGLKYHNNKLYFGEGKNFKTIDANKKVVALATVSQNIDGIEPIAKNEFIITAWTGYIFYVDKKGKYTTLMETHQQGLNTADIGYDPKTKMLYLPTFNGKSVIAYKVKR